MAQRYRHAWLMALLLCGCAREFPEPPWSQREMAARAELQNKSDFTSRLALGRLEFMHNQIDAADSVLTALVQEKPNDFEAKAWHAANRCKAAERRGPWLLGIDKIVLLWDCLTELERAGHHAGDNLQVALAQIYTDSDVGIFGAKHRAFLARDRLQRLLDSKPQAYSDADRVLFYEAAAQLEARYEHADAARRYLNQIIALNADADSVERARQRLATLPGGSR